MYFVVNQSLKMGPGKACSQVGHAVSNFYQNLISGEPVPGYAAWRDSGEKKIVLKASTAEEFAELLRSPDVRPDIIVRDAGLTQVAPGAITCLAWNPGRKGACEKLGHLKLL